MLCNNADRGSPPVGDLPKAGPPSFKLPIGGGGGPGGGGGIAIFKLFFLSSSAAKAKLHQHKTNCANCKNWNRCQI